MCSLSVTELIHLLVLRGWERSFFNGETLGVSSQVDHCSLECECQ